MPELGRHEKAHPTDLHQLHGLKESNQITAYHVRLPYDLIDGLQNIYVNSAEDYVKFGRR